MLNLFFVGTAFVALAIFNAAAATLPIVRPPVKDRTFQSTAVDNLINTLAPLFANSDLAALFTNCLPNTLDTTVYYHTPASEANSTNLDTFVITGDIEAMWLRDSSNQVLPYIPYATSDPDLQLMLEGLIARQAKSVLIDPFANAFNFKASGQGHQSDIRKPPMGPAVFEGKYEIDSLAAFLKLSYWHWRYSGDAALVRFATSSWLDAVEKLIDTGTSSCSFVFLVCRIGRLLRSATLFILTFFPFVLLCIFEQCKRCSATVASPRTLLTCLAV